MKDDKKTEVVSTKLTKNEKQQLAELAKKKETTMSKITRIAILRELEEAAQNGISRTDASFIN